MKSGDALFVGTATVVFTATLQAVAVQGPIGMESSGEAYSIQIYQDAVERSNYSGILFLRLSYFDVIEETAGNFVVEDEWYLRFTGATLDGESHWFLSGCISPYDQVEMADYDAYYPILTEQFFIQGVTRSGSAWAMIENSPSGLILIDSAYSYAALIPEPRSYATVCGFVSCVVFVRRRRK